MSAGKTILCVDDDPLARLVIQQFIKHSPVAFNAVEAKNGNDCLSFVSQSNVDLIVLDYNLGDINGCDVAKMIPSVSINPDVPIIMLSIVDHEDLEVLCDAPNLVKVVQKPYDIKNFHQDILAILAD